MAAQPSRAGNGSWLPCRFCSGSSCCLTWEGSQSWLSRAGGSPCVAPAEKDLCEQWRFCSEAAWLKELKLGQYCHLAEGASPQQAEYISIFEYKKDIL